MRMMYDQRIAVGYSYSRMGGRYVTARAYTLATDRSR